MNEWVDYFPVRVSMFGGFCIQAGSCLVDEGFARSEKMSGLLAYLILHADRYVSISDLLDSVWAETESSQPENALKMQIYRMRMLFKQAGIPFSKECIIASRACYRWNPDIPCEIDVVIYEKACQLALNARLTAVEQRPLLEHAISLYHGDFLPTCRTQSWVIPLEAYYRQLYQLTVSALIRLFNEQQLFSNISDLCRRAILMDPYWEEVHYHLMQSLISQALPNDAISHYRYMKQLFSEKLGVSISSHIDALYRGLIAADVHATAELALIRRDLQEVGRVEGAYVCDYNLFRQIYRLQARMAARSGVSMSLILLTLSALPEHKNANALLSAAMGNFFVLLRKYLRSTDLLTPYSTSQYVLMMPSTSSRDLAVAINRIISFYRAAHPKDHVSIEYLIDLVEPPEYDDWMG